IIRYICVLFFFFFFQAEDGIRDRNVTGVQTCALPISFAIFTATARADEVTEWNQTMLRAGTMAQTTPLQITRVAAIVQAAMFDAANGINARYTPIRVSPAAPAGASRRAAVVQAAWTSLSHLYGRSEERRVGKE